MLPKYEIGIYETNMSMLSGPEYCSLTFSKTQISSLNKNLADFQTARTQKENQPCDLSKKLFKSTTYTAFPDTTVETSPYGRGAPFKVGPISPFNYIRVKNQAVEYSSPHLNKNLLDEKKSHLLSPHLSEKLTYPQIIFLGDKATSPQINHLVEETDHPQQNYLGDKTIPSTNYFLADKTTNASPMSLCLDLGTQTGWALLSREKVIASGSKNFKGDRFQGGGMRFLKFVSFLGERLDHAAGQLKIVFFEVVRRHLGVDAAHAYGGFLGHLTAWCEQREIAYEGVPVGTIKRHATGKGNASKAMVIESMRQRQHKPIDDNEADALGLGLLGNRKSLEGLVNEREAYQTSSPTL